MKTYTQRPSTAWTVSSTAYHIGTSSTGVYDLRTSASTTAGASSSNTAGSTAGLTALVQNAGTTSLVYVSEIGRTVSTVSTASSLTVRNVHQSAHNPGSAINFSDTYSYTEARLIARSVAAGDSSFAATSNTSLTTGSSSTESDTHSSSTSSATAASYSTSSTSTAYTASGTSTTYTTQTVAIDLSTVTTTASDGHFNAFTTTSSSSGYTTTATSTTGSVSSSYSTWGTGYTSLTNRPTTITTATADVTWTEDDSINLTATTHARTNWQFNNLLQDTVCIMNANLGADGYNLSPNLWTFNTSAIASTQTTAALFSALYSSNASQTVTLSERSVFLTSSAPVTVITTSTATATRTATRTSTTDTAAAAETYTATGTATSYNGNSYADSDYTATWSASHSLGDVSSSQSTWTVATTTDTNAPKATSSSTIYTHSAQLTGYTSGTRWTSTTTSAEWGNDVTETGTRIAPWSSASTTVTRSSRATTADEILISSYSTWGTGTNTSSSLLGLVPTNTTRASSVSSTYTLPTWHADLHASVPSQTYQFISAGTSHLGTTNGGASLTAWTEARGRISVDARPTDDNIPALNEARFQVHPYGLAGFGGSFTASALDAYLTTTQGLASGSTFTEETLQLTATALACQGLTFYPVPSAIQLGGTGNAVSTSLISTPSVMTSEISVAATWSSTTSTTASTGTTSTTTTRAATHTIAMASQITGSYWSSDPITFNSAARSEMPGGANSGGYAIGDNAISESWKLLLRQGAASWTEYSAGQSTAALSHSTSGTDASLSLSVPHSHAIVLSMEPVLTARWDTAGNASAFSSQQHLKHQ